MDSGGNHSYEPIYGVGGYADVPAPPAAFGISIHQPFAGFVEIKWPTVATIPYQVQYKPDLVTSGSWSNLGSAVTGDGTTNSYYDSTTSDERFYQVVIP